MTDFKPVVCGIIENYGKILIARRNTQQTNGGLWEFPGGKIDSGESPSEALVRELIEELGVTIIPGQQLTSVFYEYPWIAIELVPFVCKISNGIPQPLEHEELMYVTIEEVSAFSLAPADIRVFQSYCNFHQSSALY